MAKKLLPMLVEASKKTVATYQPIINKQGMGFKNFIPATFGTHAAAIFTAKTGFYLKQTTFDELLRNPKNKADEFEAATLELCPRGVRKTVDRQVQGAGERGPRQPENRKGAGAGQEAPARARGCGKAGGDGLPDRDQQTGCGLQRLHSRHLRHPSGGQVPCQDWSVPQADHESSAEPQEYAG